MEDLYPEYRIKIMSESQGNFEVGPVFVAKPSTKQSGMGN